ncbi:unnamed protein product, partial [Brassica rapa subsp. trilocularis]
NQIELKTAPADFRFPTTNQTRHCFTRYIEFHRYSCAQLQRVRTPMTARGSPSTTALSALENGYVFALLLVYHLSPPTYLDYALISPQVDKWNEQRETGTFPGPL